MLTIQNGKFYLDGKEFKIYSGAIHYFRVVPEYWRDRLVKLKAMGLNTVETYVAWNVHEKKEGEFDFEGICDIRRFIKTAAELGLYVIVRPGPYICAEWDFGGFPAWLLKHEDLRLRCYEPRFMGYVKRYLERLFEEIGDLQLLRGGNIIAMQIENEYGSYGSDKKYLSALKRIYREAGIDCLLFTSDGESKTNLSGGRVEEELMVANFGSHPDKKFRDLRVMQPDKPLTCGEFWCGWFSYFGGSYNPGSSATQVASYLKEFIDIDASFNFYMFHGGTNFGFTAGANCYGRYQPDITSYDYGAPLSEWGDYTEKYHKCRSVLLKAQGLPDGPLPASPVTRAYGDIRLCGGVSLREAIDAVSVKQYSHIAYPMEHYGQNQGYILYSAVIEGNYGDTTLTLEGVHDFAYVYINGSPAGRFNRLDVDYYKGGSDTITLPLKAFDGRIKIDVLVEALGRVNYGEKLYDRKGITSARIADQRIYGWSVRTLELNDLSALSYFSELPSECPAFYKAELSIDGEINDTFIDMQGFTKGCVFVNGFNIGRYWNIGPQRTLYIPAPILKECNEIVIFELEGRYKDSISFSDKPIYGSYLPHNGSPKMGFRLFKKRA